MASVPDFDPNMPSIARVYDYLLNGKDNFAADREVAERLLAVAPLAAEVTRENRQFLARAGAARVYNHSVADFASFFGPLELVPPSVVDAREWRPDWEQTVSLPPRDGQVIVGVARVG
jgi:hypothetical protein